jgi:hypothetical protein
MGWRYSYYTLGALMLFLWYASLGPQDFHSRSHFH